MTPIEFISVISPVSIKLRREGSPIFPSVRIAQAALETGWKIHPWNNVVGYKVGSGKQTPYWNGKSISTKTWEVYDAVRYDNVTAFWRAYDSIDDCFRDQDLLFQLPRYDQVRAASTPEDQATALYRCGYATDPEYYRKILSIINTHNLKQYDTWEVEEYEMSPDDANKIIRFLSAAWYAAENEEAKKEFQRLANELRKASGQPGE